MKITTAVRQGARPYQEDRHFSMEFAIRHRRKWLLAVMDGHVGDEAAERCRQNIGGALELHKARRSEDTLRRVTSTLSAIVEQMSGGTTLSMALITEEPRTVSVAVVGDSPVVVYDAEGKLHLSPEHNVRSNAAERRAAESRGGVYRDGYICHSVMSVGLQLSRALGDRALSGIISREPHVYTVKDPRWVLVASDGVFDPSHGSTEELVKEMEWFAKKRLPAEEIMRWAEKRGLRDNATALVWHD